MDKENILVNKRFYLITVKEDLSWRLGVLERDRHVMKLDGFIFSLFVYMRSI